MYQLTAAHRELPLGTWILVTNLENGRAVELRVNDRGPFVGDRIVDVSYAAGRLLGMIGPGVVRVRLTVTQPAIALGGVALGAAARFAVQVGSFSSLENARAVERSLAEGFPGVEVVRRVIGAGDVFPGYGSGTLPAGQAQSHHGASCSARQPSSSSNGQIVSRSNV
jgi:rare lipoprotein A